jgi:hypothetical protein
LNGGVMSPIWKKSWRRARPNSRKAAASRCA